MYNKLFGKIVKSSIWMQESATRLVWLTFLAVMDEDGFADLASAANVAHTARVTLEEAEKALSVLSSEDPDSSDPDNEGRRLERVPGGWIVLNSAKYRNIATRLHYKEQNRARVAKHRAKCNEGVMEVKRSGNDHVMPSDTDTDTDSYTDKKKDTRANAQAFEQFWKHYPKKKNRKRAEDAFKKHKCHLNLDAILIALLAQKKNPEWIKDGGQYIPMAGTWINDRRWEDEVLETKKEYDHVRNCQLNSFRGKFGRNPESDEELAKYTSTQEFIDRQNGCY
jgi:hypothetical protein